MLTAPPPDAPARVSDDGCLPVAARHVHDPANLCFTAFQCHDRSQRRIRVPWAGLTATPLATSCSASAPLEQNLSRHGRTQGFVAGSNSIGLEVPI
jgi:hypothetical protein